MPADESGAGLVPARRLVIVLGSLPIEDGAVAPPTVGDIARFTLSFAEADHDQPDATVSVVRAWAEPLGDGSPRGPGMRWDGIPHDRPPVWPTVLHGDGWSATWSAPRPVIGQVLLRGTLSDDLEIGARTGVRARVTRIRVVTDMINTTDPDQTTWRPIAGEQRLRDVRTAPRWFSDGLVVPEGAPAAGWVCPVPGDPYVVERGVLLDLDLDHVPDPPPRPRLVPGALAADGEDLWIADTRLPLIARIGRTATEHPEPVMFGWPGRILDAENSRGRALHADQGGCWITGPDGVHRLDCPDRDDAGGSVRHLRPESAWPTAVNRGLLLADLYVEVERRHALHLINSAGDTVEVPLGDRAVQAAVADPTGTGFVLLLRHQELSAGAPTTADQPRPDSRPWLGRLAEHGVLEEGPYLDVEHPGLVELVGSSPPVVLDQHRPRRVLDDLTLDAADPRWSRVLRAYSRAGRVWLATHPPHPHDIARRGTAACWPLNQPPDYPEDRQYWLLTEVDPDSLDPVTSLLVQHVPDSLAVDDSGTVWALAAGLRRLPPENGSAAERVDLATMLDHDACQATTPRAPR